MIKPADSAPDPQPGDFDEWLHGLEDDDLEVVEGGTIKLRLVSDEEAARLMDPSSV